MKIIIQSGYRIVFTPMNKKKALCARLGFSHCSTGHQFRYVFGAQLPASVSRLIK